MWPILHDPIVRSVIARRISHLLGSYRAGYFICLPMRAACGPGYTDQGNAVARGTCCIAVDEVSGKLWIVHKAVTIIFHQNISSAWEGGVVSGWGTRPSRPGGSPEIWLAICAPIKDRNIWSFCCSILRKCHLLPFDCFGSLVSLWLSTFKASRALLLLVQTQLSQLEPVGGCLLALLPPLFPSKMLFPSLCLWSCLTEIDGHVH